MSGNKTAEQIVAEAMVSAGAPLMHSRVEEAVVTALREHGFLVSAPTGDEREASYENVATAQMSSGTITARSIPKEVSALQLIDAIYDADEDDVNDSVRYGFIFEQLERLNVIYQDVQEHARLVNADTERKLAEVRAVLTDEWLHGRVLPRYVGAENDARVRAITAIINPEEAENNGRE